MSKCIGAAACVLVWHRNLDVNIRSSAVSRLLYMYMHRRRLGTMAVIVAARYAAFARAAAATTTAIEITIYVSQLK